MERVKLSKHFEKLSTRGAITLFSAPLIFIVPPVWLGYAEYGFLSIICLGLVITLFALFLAAIDGMALKLSRSGIQTLSIIYMQITTPLSVLFLVGRAV